MDDYYCENPRSATWEKVTRKIVDPITFSCNVNVAFVPRIEDCAYETTCFAMSQPRFGEKINPGTITSNKKGSINDTTWTPMDFATGTPLQNNKKKLSRAKVDLPPGIPSMFTSFASPTKSSFSPKSKVNNNNNSSGNGKVKSLGAFFQKSGAEKQEELDNQSLSSRSLSSRSVSDRSHAERSKSEESLAQKSKDRRSATGESTSHSRDSSSTSSKHRELRRQDSKKSLSMQSIDEMSMTEFSVDASAKEKKKNSNKSSKPSSGGTLGNFLQEKSISEEGVNVEADQQSVMSGSTLGSKSISALSVSERSKTESKLRDKSMETSGHLSSFLEGSQTSLNDDDEKSLTLEQVAPGEKKLRFKEGHDAKEIPRLTDSMYDDLFYMSDELANFRYEAFMEEAGLDINEFD
jgi:hypothetical protein